ncbi:MAG: YgjV family protein [Clostridia bacterium]|nr:YgjV family protein [Clostridia bacterium]
MFELISGNLMSLCAMITDSVSATRKTTRGVLLMQTLSQLFYFTSSIFLKGYSAAVQNAMSVIRNLNAISKHRRPWVEWLLIVAGVTLGLVFNNRGVMGLLPVVSNLEYALAVRLFSDNQKILKTAFLINSLLYCVFNAYVMNFVGVFATLTVAVTTTIAIIRMHKAPGQKA